MSEGGKRIAKFSKCYTAHEQIENFGKQDNRIKTDGIILNKHFGIVGITYDNVLASNSNY